MENILSTSSSAVLEQFVWSRLLIAMDFDGTVAPIVAERAAARARRLTASLAMRLGEMYPCAIVSSRSSQDLAPRLAGFGRWSPWSGNSHISTDALARVKAWRSELEGALSPFQGVDIEDKGSRLTVHYRRSRSKREVLEALRVVTGTFTDVRVVTGKQVVHIQPSDVADKATALDEMIREHSCDTALYVGDDETDEDVFARDEPSRILSVRVGHSPSSHASYFIPDQRHIDVLLKRLITLRAKIGQRGGDEVRGPLPAAGSSLVESGDLEPAHEVLTSLRELDHLKETRSRALEESVGITAQQLAVIRLVGRFPGISPGVIAERMRVDPSALTPMLKVLVRQGVICRTIDPSNQRRHRLGLSARGRQLDTPRAGTLEMAVARTVSTSSPDNVRAALRFLRQLARAMLA